MYRSGEQGREGFTYGIEGKDVLHLENTEQEAKS